LKEIYISSIMNQFFFTKTGNWEIPTADCAFLFSYPLEDFSDLIFRFSATELEFRAIGQTAKRVDYSTFEPCTSTNIVH
jgi:hypothetical protein